MSVWGIRSGVACIVVVVLVQSAACVGASVPQTGLVFIFYLQPKSELVGRSVARPVQKWWAPLLIQAFFNASVKSRNGLTKMHYAFSNGATRIFKFQCEKQNGLNKMHYSKHFQTELPAFSKSSVKNKMVWTKCSKHFQTEPPAFSNTNVKNKKHFCADRQAFSNARSKFEKHFETKKKAFSNDEPPKKSIFAVLTWIALFHQGWRLLRFFKYDFMAIWLQTSLWPIAAA